MKSVKRIFIGLLTMAFATQAAPLPSKKELKQARELYVSRGCVGCHQYPELTKAPPLSAVSAKYAKHADALKLITHSLTNGSMGKWGALEMPPQAHLQDAERNLLARWVISLHETGEMPAGSSKAKSSIVGKASFDAAPKLKSNAWTQFAYYGSGKTSMNWQKQSQNVLFAKSNAPGVVAFVSAGGSRAPADPVELTVSNVQETGKPWAQVGLMISATARPTLLGSQPKYEWIVRRETNGAGWDYRVRKDVGTGNYELYASEQIDPSAAVRLEISRNGDHYEFRANGKLHYTTGDHPKDVYSTKTKDAMMYFAATFGSDSAMRAVIDDFTIGGVTPKPPKGPSAPPAQPAPAGPSGEGLFIERHVGNVIEIVDKPLVYRTYVHGIASRAITVGLPNGTSYAFDADVCRLAFAWSGGFLNIEKSWTGFGGWYSKLLGEKFYEAPAGFPLRVGDPNTVPKPQFKGYDLVNGLPIFKYLINGQLVRHSIATGADGKSINHQFSLPGNTKPVYFVGGNDAATMFASPDAAWKNGRWVVRKDKTSQFSIGVVQ